MGAVKQYLNDLICACSDEQMGQDAIDYAIQMERVKLICDFETDVKTVMSQYDRILEDYRREVSRSKEALLNSYGPLFDAIDGRRVA